jgi:hypothetical protein
MFRIYDKLVIYFKLNKRVILFFKVRKALPKMLRMSSETVVKRFSTLLPVTRNSKLS